MKQKKKKKMTSELAIKNELKNKIILITGGAGSIGSALTAELLKYPVRSIRVFDNDEHSLFQLKQSLNNSKIDLLLGDIFVGCCVSCSNECCVKVFFKKLWV